MRTGARRCLGLAAVVVLVSVRWSPAQNRGQERVQDAALAEQDGRLNTAYRERLTQLSGNPAAVAELRGSERDWIRQRDKTCGQDTGCLARVTGERAELLRAQDQQGSGAKGKGPQPIPMELWGSWAVQKVLPAETITCWDNAQARAMIGSRIDYHPDWFGWKRVKADNLGWTATEVTAKQFAEDNSGGGANSSQVSFGQLGIKAPAVKQITIRHPEVKLPDESMEMPGETVLLTGPGKMIFSVCNVYFEASRMTD